MSYLIERLGVPEGGELQLGKPIANTITFPKELHEAIPPHSARVLEFDRVTGTVNQSWANAANSEWLRARGYDTSAPRAQAFFQVHETGRLAGEYNLALDLDADSMQALGEYLIALAEAARAH